MIAALFGVAYLSFAAYKNWWKKEWIGASGVFERSKEKARPREKKSIVQRIGEGAQGAKERYIDSLVAKVSEQLEQGSRETAFKAVSLVDEKLDAVQSALGEGGAGKGSGKEEGTTANRGTAQGSQTGTVNASTASEGTFLIPPPPATLVVQDGEMRFAVNGRTGGSAYKVVWGDGVVETGNAPPLETNFLPHTWKTDGDYTVQIIVTDSAGVHAYTFPVRVKK